MLTREDDMVSEMNTDADLLKSLSILKEAGTRTYYDQETDQKERQSYYAEFLENQTNRSLTFELLTTDKKKKKLLLKNRLCHHLRQECLLVH